MAKRVDGKIGRRSWYSFSAHPLGDVHQAVKEQVEFIRRQQRGQRDAWRNCMDLYAAGNVSGLENRIPAWELGRYVFDETALGRTRFNLVSAVVDTAESMVCNSPAVPIIMTTAGDFGIVRKAAKKTQVLQAQCREIASRPNQEAMVTAMKVGTGFVHAYQGESGLVEAESVHPLQIFIEHTDGIDRKPRSVHRVKLVSRDILAELFPEHDRVILSAPPPGDDLLRDYYLQREYSTSDAVAIVESWHFGFGKHIGRHSITIDGATLSDEKLDPKDPASPRCVEDVFSVFRWRNRDKGFFGQGLVERVLDTQLRINQLIERNDRAQDLASNVTIMNPIGQQITVRHEKFVNAAATIVDYDPAAGEPHLAKWEGTLFDLQAQIDLEFQRTLLVEGLSPEQVGGERQKGLSSGVAVRASDDVQSRRLVSPSEQFQAGCIATAKVIIRANDAVAADDPSYVVKGTGEAGAREFVRSSRWKELDIPEGNASVTMMPMSALPTTPQGKWAAVMEWVEAGWVDQTYARQLVRFPDIDSYADLEDAHIDVAKWQIEKILDGETVRPIPRQNLQLAVDIATKSELKAYMLSADDDIIDAFELFIFHCEDMLARAMAAQAPPPAAAGPAMGAPTPGPSPEQLVTQLPMAPPVGQVA